jgi:hypothetical protein
MFYHFLGVAEDADECFSEATSLHLQQNTHQHHVWKSQSLPMKMEFYLPVPLQA